MENMETIRVPAVAEESKIKKLIKQFAKFVVVGIVNTGIDFGVLNAEMAITGIASGKMMFILNAVSFSIATTNSFFLNKYWTFQAKEKSDSGVKFSQFLGVSIIGIIINSAIVFALTTYVSPVAGLSPKLWANAAKILATGISLIFNFVGYKFWVFKK
ncbi:MAG: GtrA family protein [bacterium]|nr:GtrA family protein [bacterium]